MSLGDIPPKRNPRLKNGSVGMMRRKTSIRAERSFPITISHALSGVTISNLSVFLSFSRDIVALAIGGLKKTDIDSIINVDIAKISLPFVGMAK